MAKAEIAEAPPQPMTMTITNAELVNLLVEQHIDLLNQEVKALRAQYDELDKERTRLHGIWWAQEKARLEQQYLPAAKKILEGMLMMYPTATKLELGISSYASDSQNVYHHMWRVLNFGGVARFNLSLECDPVDNEGNFLECEQYDDNTEAIRDVITGVQNVDFKVTRNDEWNALVELCEKIKPVTSRINEINDSLAERQKLEQKALAKLTARCVQQSTELQAILVNIASEINDGQLLIE
jgi:hypothetical protein